MFPFLLIFLFLTSCTKPFEVKRIILGSNSRCPKDFIFVPGNSLLGTEDFCVMKYEARVDEKNNLVFDVSQFPKTNISHVVAFDVCKNHNDDQFDGSFALISNSEWMTIARLIENNPKNWSSGVVGSGMLAKGHSDAVASNYQQTRTLASVTNITDPFDYYNQTGNSSSQFYRVDSSCDMEAYNSGSFDGQSIYGWEQRRVHYIESEEVIWDFSGNAAEFVDWSSSDSIYTYGPSDAHVDKEEVTNLYGSLLPEDLSPTGDYGFSYGVGKWVMRNDDTRGVTTRGGHVRECSVAGIYSLSTTTFKKETGHNNISFRCVYKF